MFPGLENSKWCWCTRSPTWRKHMPSSLRPRFIFDTGSLAKVHKTCLETWLGNQAIDQCEICKFHYVTARRPKGFHEWLINSSTREDKQNLIGDMVALLLLTPLVVFSLWLCTEGAIQFSHEGFPTWESAGLVFITIVLFVVFCVWVTLLYR